MRQTLWPTDERYMKSMLSLILVAVSAASCNLIDVRLPGRSQPSPGTERQAAKPTERQAANPTSTGSARPRMMQRPLERAAADGIIVEGELRKQYCAELGKRAAPLMQRLAASQKSTNALAQLDQHAQLLQEVKAMTATLQNEYNAAYKTQSHAADRSNIAGDVGIGYGSSDNSTSLAGNEFIFEVLVSATKLMRDGGLPFSVGNHGLVAGSVVMVGQSNCESPRATTLASQLEANTRSLVAPFDVSKAILSEPLPVTNGAVLAVRGDVASINPLTVRITTEQNHYNKCTTTNRFDHFDANGNARYQENCRYTGTNKGVVTIVASGVDKVLPTGITVEVGDEVNLLGRVTANETKAASRGKAFLRTTQVTLTPLAFTSIVRRKTVHYTY